jgi:hypothetical protein
MTGPAGLAVSGTADGCWRVVLSSVREHIKVLGGNEGLEAIVAKICAPLREEDSIPRDMT